MRASAKKRVYNLRTKTKVKTAVKSVRSSLSASSKQDAIKALQEAFSAIDKAAKKNVIHKNTADRKKSRLAKAIAKLK